MQFRTKQSPGTNAALIAAGGLLACAAAVQYLSYKAEVDHPPTGKVFDVHGNKVHFIDRGSGPCVVLLPGTGAMIEDLQSSGLIDILARNHRVVAFDRPGYGRSDRPGGGDWIPEREAEYLSEVLKAVGVEKPIVVGHSWGTLVALSMALRDPAAISGLVLVSGYYVPTARLDVALQTPASLPVIGQALRYTIMPLLTRLTAKLAFKKMFSPLEVSPEFLAIYPLGLACRPSQLKSVADDTVEMPVAAARLRERLSEIRPPIYILAGTDDQIVSTELQSTALHETIPGSELRLLPGVGHMVHHANPKSIVTAVEAVASRIAVPEVSRKPTNLSNSSGRAA